MSSLSCADIAVALFSHGRSEAHEYVPYYVQHFAPEVVLRLLFDFRNKVKQQAQEMRVLMKSGQLKQEHVSTEQLEQTISNLQVEAASSWYKCLGSTPDSGYYLHSCLQVMHYALIADHSRLILSTPLRLMQQKTQVFPLDINATSRSRLTHSHEVANYAQLCVNALVERCPKLRPLQDNMSLCVSNAALMHDLGNPPFGHFGEQILRKWLQEICQRYGQGEDSTSTLASKAAKAQASTVSANKTSIASGVKTNAPSGAKANAAFATKDSAASGAKTNAASATKPRVASGVKATTLSGALFSGHAGASIGAATGAKASSLASLSAGGKRGTWVDPLRPLSLEQVQDLCAFNGNAQGIRLVHSIEQLNLTVTQIAAAIKVPFSCAELLAQGLSTEEVAGKTGYFLSERELMEHLASSNLGSKRHPLSLILEQCDDLAYVLADLEDAYDREVVRSEEIYQLITDLIEYLFERSIRLGEQSYTSLGAEAQARSVVKRAFAASHGPNEFFTEEMLSWFNNNRRQANWGNNASYRQASYGYPDYYSHPSFQGYPVEASSSFANHSPVGSAPSYQNNNTIPSYTDTELGFSQAANAVALAIDAHAPSEFLDSIASSNSKTLGNLKIVPTASSAEASAAAFAAAHLHAAPSGTLTTTADAAHKDAAHAHAATADTPTTTPADVAHKDTVPANAAHKNAAPSSSVGNITLEPVTTTTATLDREPWRTRASATSHTPSDQEMLEYMPQDMVASLCFAPPPLRMQNILQTDPASAPMTAVSVYTQALAQEYQQQSVSAVVSAAAAANTTLSLHGATATATVTNAATTTTSATTTSAANAASAMASASTAPTTEGASNAQQVVGGAMPGVGGAMPGVGGAMPGQGASGNMTAGTAATGAPGAPLSQGSTSGNLADRLCWSAWMALVSGLRIPLHEVILDALKSAYCRKRNDALEVTQKVFGSYNMSIHELVSDLGVRKLLALLREIIATTYIDELVSAIAKDEETFFQERRIPDEVSQSDAHQAMSFIKNFENERIFTNNEVEALELQGAAFLQGILNHYEHLLTLKTEEFLRLVNNNQGDSISRHLVHRLAPRYLEAYQRYVSKHPDEEFYARVRLLIDFVSGMNDTYAAHEYAIVSGNVSPMATLGAF